MNPRVPTRLLARLCAATAVALLCGVTRAVDPDDIGRVVVPDSPYRSCPPWGTVINGVPVIVFGYPPYYGPQSRVPDNEWFAPYSRARTYYRTPFPGTPLHEVTRRLDPNVVQPPTSAPPAPTSTRASTNSTSEASRAPMDLGLEALRGREYARAVMVYERLAREREELEASAGPDAQAPDRTAMRLLGLALIGAGDLKRAEQAVIGAYEQDTALSSRGFDVKRHLGSPSALRRMVNQAVSHAHKTNTAGAWTMVGHLMSLEGRDAVAKKMHERAAQVGAGVGGSPTQPAEATATLKPADHPHGPASFSMPK